MELKNNHLKIPYCPLKYCDINPKSQSYFVCICRIFFEYEYEG